MKTTTRGLSILLMVATLLSMLLLPLSAAGETVFYENTFSAATDVGADKLINRSDRPILSNAQGSTTPALEIVNGAWRIPCKVQTNEVSAYLKHASITSAAAPILVYEGDYTFSANAAATDYADIRAASHSFDATTVNGTAVSSGAWLNLATFYPTKMTYFDDAGQRNIVGKHTLTPGTTYRIKIVIDTVNGTYWSYVNGELDYESDHLNSQQKINGSWCYFPIKGLSLGNNRFIAANLYSKANATNASAYLDIDNIKLYADPNAVQKVTVKVDGKDVSVTAGAPIDLTPATAGHAFVYAAVTDAAGKTTYTVEPTVKAADGLTVTTHSVYLASGTDAEIRLGTPEGIRFTTLIDPNALDALKNDPNIAAVRIGTLIAPQDYLGTEVALTKEDLTAAKGNGAYLEVPATIGEWYTFSSPRSARFAGSILNIKEANLNRAFAGVGYLEVTLKDGTVSTAYAVCKDPASASVTRLAVDRLSESKNGLSQSQIKLLERYAALYNGTTRKSMAEDLYNLNVMAIGDSLFGGHTLGTQGQWFNLLAKECKWMLSNYGMNGWTMAYNPGAYPAGATVRNSIYDKLFNANYYVFGRSPGTVTYNYSSHTSASAADVDVIFLEGGINDSNWGIPCGAVASTDPSCCMGAYNKVIGKLLTDFPNAKIVLVTTWQQAGSPGNNKEGLTYNQYTGRLVELYNTTYQSNDRVLLLDAGNPAVSGVNMDNAAFTSKYAMDKNHLNAAGMEYMKEQMLEPIWKLLVGEAS